MRHHQLTYSPCIGQKVCVGGFPFSVFKYESFKAFPDSGGPSHWVIIIKGPDCCQFWDWYNCSWKQVAPGGCSREMLHKLENTAVCSSAQCLTTHPGTPSGPAALLGLMWLRPCLTLCGYSVGTPDEVSCEVSLVMGCLSSLLNHAMKWFRSSGRSHNLILVMCYCFYSL